jgi:hypothetical protein
LLRRRTRAHTLSPVGCLRRPAHASQGEAKAQTPGRGRHPGDRPVRPAPPGAHANCIQLNCVQGFVGQRQPAARPVLGPVGQRPIRLALLAPPQSAPLPPLGAGDHSCAQCVGLYVAADGQEVVIVKDPHPGVSAVQDVGDEAGFDSSGSTRHGRDYALALRRGQQAGGGVREACTAATCAMSGAARNVSCTHSGYMRSTVSMPRRCRPSWMVRAVMSQRRRRLSRSSGVWA